MFCKYCGDKLDTDAVFCPSCGKKIVPDQDIRKLDHQLHELVKENGMPEGIGMAEKPVVPTLDSYCKRAYLFLDDEDWVSASDCFDRALDIDSEYAPAYIGKVMAKYHIKREDDLSQCPEPIDGDADYKKAIRFADEERKVVYLEYNDAILKRIKQEHKEEVYQRVIALVHSAGRTSSEWDRIMKELENPMLDRYKDIEFLRVEARNNYADCLETEKYAGIQEREAAYLKIINAMNNTSNKSDDWSQIMKWLSVHELDNYRNVNQLREKAFNKYVDCLEAEKAVDLEEKKRKALEEQAGNNAEGNKKAEAKRQKEAEGKKAWKKDLTKWLVVFGVLVLVGIIIGIIRNNSSSGGSKDDAYNDTPGIYYINKLKGGHHEDFPDITLEKAYISYYSNPQWDYYFENNEHHIRFFGSLHKGDKEEKVEIDFKYGDGHFDPVKVKVNGQTVDSNLMNIYINDPFADYHLHSNIV